MLRITALALVLVMSLTGVALAGKEPPSEPAAVAATKNLLTVLGVGDARQREDTLARFVDADRISLRMFGVEALEKTSDADRKLLGVALRTFLMRGLFDRMPHPEKPSELRASSTELPGGLRQVAYRAGEEEVHVVWASGTSAPKLVDIGKPGDGLMTTYATRMWKESRQTPLGFMQALLKKLSLGAATKDEIKSKDNIRTLITLMIARRTAKISGGYPSYNGKRFILSLVATNQLDRRNPDNLEILFSPADKRLSLKKAGTEAYLEVTKQSLKAGTMDFSSLTSYAGRRNRERAWLVTADQEMAGTPLIADLSFPDRAIVGFSNGSVRVMTRKELGLGPDDPIVAGDASKSKLLQKLSSE